MPLINEPTGPETLLQKQRETKRRLQHICTVCFAAMKSNYFDGVKLVNENPYGLTREEVLAGLGEDAAELLLFAAALRDTLNTAVPGTVVQGSSSGG